MRSKSDSTHNRQKRGRMGSARSRGGETEMMTFGASLADNIYNLRKNTRQNREILFGEIPQLLRARSESWRGGSKPNQGKKVRFCDIVYYYDIFSNGKVLLTKRKING